jgi:hypothetical protein
MSEKEELRRRFVLFLVGCIGIRTGFAFGAAKVDKKYLPYLGVLGLLLAISWVLIYRFNLRPTGREAGGIIWWNKIRLVHALLYFVFAVLAFSGSDYAWVPLGIDVFVGLTAFVNHHWSNGDITRVVGKLKNE